MRSRALSADGNEAAAAGGGEVNADIPNREELPLQSFYTAVDAADLEHLRFGAGAPPTCAGPTPACTVRPWTIRQYAGFSTAGESNAFYRRNLAAGQMGLSVAFDLADPPGLRQRPPGKGDVGKAGGHQQRGGHEGHLRRHPAGQDERDMTMNGAVLPIMAFYIVAAEEQGVARNSFRAPSRTTSWKEFMVRNTYIYPPGPSMRIVIGDIFGYCARRDAALQQHQRQRLPPMHEAGAPADLEARLHPGRRPGVRAHRHGRRPRRGCLRTAHPASSGASAWTCSWKWPDAAAGYSGPMLKEVGAKDRKT